MIEVGKTIQVDLGEMLDWMDIGGLDRLLDEMAERAAGTILLQEIDFIPVGVEPDGTLRLRVTGYLDPEDANT